MYIHIRDIEGCIRLKEVFLHCKIHRNVKRNMKKYEILRFSTYRSSTYQGSTVFDVSNVVFYRYFLNLLSGYLPHKNSSLIIPYIHIQRYIPGDDRIKASTDLSGTEAVQ